MSFLLLEDVPSSASIDDVGVLIAQFAAIRQIVVLSSGPGAPGKAIVCLEPDAIDLQVLAETLDCHPCAGGLLSVRVCEDALRFLVSSVSGQVRSSQTHGRDLDCLLGCVSSNAWEQVAF